MSRTIVNALTFDVEDWHQLVEWKLNGVMPMCSPHVQRQTREVLDLLAAHGVRATFFVLGLVARAAPQLVKDIYAAGHEIGSHGWSHALVYRQTEAAFAQESRTSKALLEDIIGGPIAGYRAAEFSITDASGWALPVLADLGFKYDSSIFPFRGNRYGIPRAPLDPHPVATPRGNIVELPLTVVEWGSRRYPVGGGGYFRILPYTWTRSAIARTNAAGRAAVAYFHPYEFSSEPLVPRTLHARSYVKAGRYVVFHNINRRRNRRRLERLLTDCRFTTASEILHIG